MADRDKPTKSENPHKVAKVKVVIGHNLWQIGVTFSIELRDFNKGITFNTLQKLVMSALPLEAMTDPVEIANRIKAIEGVIEVQVKGTHGSLILD